MRKIVLFIAMSLDGYIADINGGVDWLSGHGSNEENIDAYSEFIKDIDTVIMGWKTYHQVKTELSPDEWVYSGLKSYVITHNDIPATEEIEYVNDEPCELVKRLKCEKGRDIWICGGAEIVQQLISANIIDKYYISVIPTILGNGVRLFAEAEQEIKLRLVKTQNYNGIVDLVYERR